MTRTMLVASLMILNLASCRSNNLDLSKVQWVPTYLDVAREDDVKMIVLLWDYGATANHSGSIEDWDEVERITEPAKIKEIQKALETAEPDESESWCYRIFEIKMAVINKSNQGLIMGLEPDDMSRKVYFCGGHSKELFEILPDLDLWEANDTNDIDLSKVQWAPTFEDFFEREGEQEESIKMLVFLENDANKPENCTELGRITNLQKIEEFIEVLDENIKGPGWEGKVVKMAIVNKKNQGLILKMAWSYTNKRVLSYQRYSERAFKILEELKIIDNEKDS